MKNAVRAAAARSRPTILVLLAVALAGVPAIGHAASATDRSAQLRAQQFKAKQFKPMTPRKINPALTSPGLITGQGRVQPGYNCVSLCGSSCASLSCSGLNVSQCQRTRQTCRVNCRSRC